MSFQVGDRVTICPVYCHPNGCGRIYRIDGEWAYVLWDAGLRDTPFRLDKLYPEPRPMVRDMVLGDIVDWADSRPWLRVVSPKIVSKANDLQSNDVRPKPPQDAFSDEWGKWWWDTRHTRGRVP